MSRDAPKREVSAAAYEYLMVEIIREFRRAAATEEDDTAGASGSRARDVSDASTDARVEAALERLGASVGRRIARLAASSCDPASDEQQAMTILCREFWTRAFGRRADALRTNNRGTFVVHDDAFAPMRSVPVDTSGTDRGADARAHLAAHAGCARGALEALGVRARARGETRQPPDARGRRSAASTASTTASRHPLGRAEPPAVAFVLDVDRAP